MTKDIDARTQVAIIGAGIVGLHSAIQLAKRGLQVTVLAPLATQKYSYKVGESLLIFSNAFLRTVSELDDYHETCPKKHGVWFIGDAEGRESFDGCNEFGLNAMLPDWARNAAKDPLFMRAMADDVQIVRPEAEALMLETARAHANITILDTVRVTAVDIADGDGDHVVHHKCKVTGDTGAVAASWIVDCSGRNRVLAKHLGHAHAPNDLREDEFQTTGVWAQFQNVGEDRFEQLWTASMPNGTDYRRDSHTLHLWGDGYWLWIIRLADNRISVGVTYDHRWPSPAGENYRARFWEVVRRYRLFDDMLSEDNLIEFHSLKNVQYLSDTFVSHRRYALAGDSAAIVDAYYSQGISLNLVTSWHIANIIEKHATSGDIDTEYVERVNRYTLHDWLIMRDTVKYKYTPAIRDGRFFFLSHLLDVLTFVRVGWQKIQLAQWLSGTNGETAGESELNAQRRAQLESTLFLSKHGAATPEKLAKKFDKLQAKLARRAQWRLDNGIRVPNVRALITPLSGLLRFWLFPFVFAKAFFDATSKKLMRETNLLKVTGEEVRCPTALKLAGPLMTALFRIMYTYDWLATGFSRVWVWLRSPFRRRRRSEKSLPAPTSATPPRASAGGSV